VTLIDLKATVGGADDGSIVLWLAGELNVESAPLVNTVVHTALTEGETNVVLDLSDVDLLDSSGVGVLLVAHRAAELRGATLTVRAPRKQALDTLLLTGCEHVLNVQPLH
jgi:anti-sigma B factor antagonist